MSEHEFMTALRSTPSMKSARCRSNATLRAGYSLLEIILAVAILAGGGLMLQATLGQSTRLGIRAEERTRATELAQSLLDQTLAFGELGERQEQGFFDNAPEWAYRVSIESIDALPRETPMRRIVVDVLPARSLKSTASNSRSLPTCRMARWIRANLDQASDRSRRESANSSLDRAAGGSPDSEMVAP